MLESRARIPVCSLLALTASACLGATHRVEDDEPSLLDPATVPSVQPSSEASTPATNAAPTLPPVLTATSSPAPVPGAPLEPEAVAPLPTLPLGPLDAGVLTPIGVEDAALPFERDAAAPVPVAPSGSPTPLLGDVALSEPSQSFVGELDVVLSTALADAEIRYTTDGSVPDETAAAFDGTPLALVDTTQLRAQAFVAGAPVGAMTTGIYIARTFDAASNLPLVIVDGYGGGKPSDKDVYLDAAVMVFEPVDGVSSFGALPTIATRAGYHLRGQSSSNFPQAPYRLEFWDNQDADADYAVMGMAPDSDWAIIGPYYDRTLIRNPFVYELGREMGMASVRTAFAEVYVNYDGGPVEESHYQGVYWFTETIKNKKERLDLEQLEQEDVSLPEISGGYIMKFDQAAAEEPLLPCTGSAPIAGFGRGDEDDAGPGTCWRDLELVDPGEPNQEQLDWLTSYVQTVHDGLQQDPMFDYAANLDLGSFIDYLIVSEVTMNVDAYVRSCYFHKDRDGLLAAGPLWDYNFALGGVGAMHPVPDPEDDDSVTFRFESNRNVNNWYPRLVTDPSFMAAVRARYTELRQTLLSDEAVKQRIDALTAPLTEAAERDFARWPVSEVITSESGFTGGPIVPTWTEQVQVMRDFLDARLAWLDENL